MTKRQINFCERYLKGDTKAEALLAAGYKSKNVTAAANRLLQLPEVKKYLQEHRGGGKKEVADNVEILQYLTMVLRSNDEEVTVRDKMRAAELLGKNGLLFSEDKAKEATQIVFCDQNHVLD